MEENISFIQRNVNLQSDNEQVIKVTPTLKQDIITSAKWGKFFGILSYIAAGICFIAALVMLFTQSYLGGLFDYSTVLGGFYKWFMFIIMLLCTALYVFCGYYLLKTSNNIKDGIETKNQSMIEVGFYYLKTFLTVMGIITIIVLGIYALTFLAGIVLGIIAAI